MFCECVTNLHINILNANFKNFPYLQYFLEQFDNLASMYIRTEANVSPHQLVVPHVRHLAFEESQFRHYSQLHGLSIVYPELKRFELKQHLAGRLGEALGISESNAIHTQISKPSKFEKFMGQLQSIDTNVNLSSQD